MNRQQLRDALDRIGLGNNPHLLIDGRNCCYRAIYANRGNSQGPRYHSLVVMLRFMHTWIEHFQPQNVHVFWDAPRASLWRRRILATYKERDSQYTLGVDAELMAVQEAAQAILKHLNVHQYQRRGQEADDLIYAFCRVVQEQPSLFCPLVVVSSDGDFTQLLYRFNNVLVYEPRRNELVDCPAVDPVVQKSLMGDNTDRVGGYKGVGPVTSARLAGSLPDRLDFLDRAGRSLYIRNRLLLDLSLCPYLLANIMYVERVLCEATSYNKQEVIKLSRSLKIAGLFQEYERICFPFRQLGKSSNSRTA